MLQGPILISIIKWDPVLQRIEVGNQVGTDTAVMGVGEGAGVAFYTTAKGTDNN